MFLYLSLPFGYRLKLKRPLPLSACVSSWTPPPGIEPGDLRHAVHELRSALEGLKPARPAILISSKRREIDLSREDCDKAIHAVDKKIARIIRVLGQDEFFPSCVDFCRQLRTLEDARAVIDQAFDLAS